MTNRIRISDGQFYGSIEVVAVSLDEILNLIDNGNEFFWSILDLEATGDLGKEKWEQLEQLETSLIGTRIDWDDIVEISKKFWQVINLTLIGCKDQKNLKKYNTDLEMYKSCDIVIEMIDSSYWEVFSKDSTLIDRLEKTFKDTKLLDPNCM